MSWLAVDKNGTEAIFNIKPIRDTNEIKPIPEMWALLNINAYCIHLPKGSIEKLIGKKLTWEDEPFEIK